MRRIKYFERRHYRVCFCHSFAIYRLLAQVMIMSLCVEIEFLKITSFAISAEVQRRWILATGNFKATAVNSKNTFRVFLEFTEPQSPTNVDKLQNTGECSTSNF